MFPEIQPCNPAITNLIKPFLVVIIFAGMEVHHIFANQHKFINPCFKQWLNNIPL